MPAIKTSPATVGKTKASIILLHGSDEAAIKKNARARSESLAPADSLNFEIIDAQVETVDEAIRRIDELRAAILTLPFFGGGKLVWWKNVNFLDDGVVGRSAQVKEALEGLIPDLEKVDGESVTLLVSALTLHKGRVFSKALLGMAEASAHDLPDLRRDGPEEGINRIAEKCCEAGLTPEPGAAERLYLAIGYNPAALDAELEKLALYLGANARLTSDAVRELVGVSAEVLIWDFCDAVLSSKPKQALALLQRLLAQEESEVGLLIVLAGRVRLAALAGMLQERGMLKFGYRGVDVTAAGQTLLPKKKSGEPTSTWVLGQVAQKSKNRSAAFWFRAVDILHRAQREMLTGVADKRRVLEIAVLQASA
jgi:DNA polymerase III subunit delta